MTMLQTMRADGSEYIERHVNSDQVISYGIISNPDGQRALVAYLPTDPTILVACRDESTSRYVRDCVLMCVELKLPRVDRVDYEAFLEAGRDGQVRNVMPPRLIVATRRQRQLEQLPDDPSPMLQVDDDVWLAWSHVEQITNRPSGRDLYAVAVHYGSTHYELVDQHTRGVIDLCVDWLVSQHGRHLTMQTCLQQFRRLETMWNNTNAVPAATEPDAADERPAHDVGLPSEPLRRLDLETQP